MPGIPASAPYAGRPARFQGFALSPARFGDGTPGLKAPRVAPWPSACRVFGQKAWLGYGSDATVIYGGTPLPAAPVGVAPGWASAAFSPDL